MKKHPSLLFVLIFLFLPYALAQSKGKQPESDGWISLFNGKNLDGWTPKFAKHNLGENYKNTFRVENGVLKVSYDEYERFDGEFGHLFYKDKFSDYKIRVEYRFVGTQIPGGPK